MTRDKARRSKSWIDRLTEWIDDIPVPTWLVYTVFTAGTVALGQIFYPPDQPEIPGWVLTILSPLGLGIYHWLRAGAAKAFDGSRSALALTDAEADDLAFRLTYLPAWVGWFILSVELAYLPAYVLLGPEPMGYRSLSPVAVTLGLISWALGESAIWAISWQTIRRFILVSRMPRKLARIELFRQQPLHALSVVTRRGALALFVTYAYIPALTEGSSLVQDPLYLWTLVVGVILAGLAAVVPLLGTHRALAEERRSRATETGHRIQRVSDALNVAVDAGDSAAIDQELKALGALTAQRALIDSASTWPWPPGTIRNVATTFLIPLGLLLAREVVNRYM